VEKIGNLQPAKYDLSYLILSLPKEMESDLAFPKSALWLCLPTASGRRRSWSRCLLEADCGTFGEEHTEVGHEKHLYVVPATNPRCLYLGAKFSHDGAGLDSVVRIN
jgi:hypothetical protein